MPGTLAAILLVLLPPLAAALFIGAGLLGGLLRPVQHESLAGGVAKAALYVSTLATLLLPGLLGEGPLEASVGGAWLQSGEFTLTLDFAAGGLRTWLALLFALLFVVVFRFATQYLHSEAGFYRFFFFLCLFAFAMFLLLLAGNALLTFVAWELAGLTSWALIAYNWRRAQVAANATRVFLIQRAGDAGFLLALVLMLLWTGGMQWSALADPSVLSERQALLLALTFMLPAFVKSAQFPYTPWLFRAMEGPTPSSAVFYGVVMVHAGVFLALLLEPLFERSTLAMALLAIGGALTALYAFFVGRSQTDIKTSMACATAAQTGLMFLECGLGLWTLAAWHLAAHAVVRCYLFLRSPSILHNAHNLPVTPVTAPTPWLQAASLQQLWLDPLLDWMLLRPTYRLARDLDYFEMHVVDPLIGAPAPIVQRVSARLQQEEGRIGARLHTDKDGFAHGSGLAGNLTAAVATVSEWFERRFIMQGVVRDMISVGRVLGHAANRFEKLLSRPRYVVVFIAATLLLAL